MKDYHN